MPSLQTICLNTVAQYFYQNVNLDEPLLEQTQKVKESLEYLPDSLQEKVIEAIDFMLCPQWQEATRSLHVPYYLNNLERYESYFFGCNSLGFFVHDNDNNITYQKNNQERNDPIENIMRVSSVPLLLGFSSRAISFFSSDVPFRYLGKKELDGKKFCVISTDERRVMYIATPNEILTFLCDGIKDQASLENQSFGKLSFFNDGVKSPDNPILSLALTHDNQFLYVGCKKKPSYKICLTTETVEKISQKKVDHIIVSDNDSIVSMSHYKKKTKIITSQKAASVDGTALCIKNNIVIASDTHGDLLGYNVHGNLLKKFKIREALRDRACCFVAYKNNFPGLIHVDGFGDQQVDIFCVPEKLTIDSVYKLAFKMAVEKAIDANRKDVLARLDNAEATLSLFPQPAILHNRIRKKLDEKQLGDYSSGKLCIIS